MCRSVRSGGESPVSLLARFVPGSTPGQLYGYRVEGPSAPERGLRFDATKVLLDPYGRGVVVPKDFARECGMPGRR